jgi:N-acetylneuraminic acid mutarotase
MAYFQRFDSLSLFIVAISFFVAACAGNDSSSSGVSTNVWTWVSGSNSIDQKGSYGTKGISALTNVPGARSGAVSWTDASGNLWLFGGSYLNEPTGSMGGSLDGGFFNDLWKFDGTQWTWVSGSNTEDQVGNFGTMGIAAPSNVPGSRKGAVSWIDESGNLWLFGGFGVVTNDVNDYLNDLWKFDGTQWTWVSGSDTGGQAGNYGTLDIAADTNVPGARESAVSWTDKSGNLWLFGGQGYDSTNSLYYLNDLWRFDGIHWAWISGSDTRGENGNYGEKGIAADANEPGARSSPVSWTDSDDNLWLFGGYGEAASGPTGYLNDLWKFDGTQWTWISGSNSVGQTGNYGELGVAASTNIPGSRYVAVSWTDANGNFWLFGGSGFDGTGSTEYLNDLWMYDGTQWTWISGSDIGGQDGTYGVKGKADIANEPGGRLGAVSWIDAKGKFWLFGGSSTIFAFSNDLWLYQQ